MNYPAVMGLITGVLIGIVLVFIISKVSNTDKKVKNEYDERQKMVRGKGYKLSFFTVVIWSSLLAFLSISGVEIPADSGVLFFSVVFVGVLVECSYCIWNDGYWALNNDRASYKKFFWIVGLFNAFVSFVNIKNGSMFEGGIMRFSALNLMAAFLFVVLGVVLWLKSLKDKHEEGDDDGEES